MKHISEILPKVIENMKSTQEKRDLEESMWNKSIKDKSSQRKAATGESLRGQG